MPRLVVAGALALPIAAAILHACSPFDSVADSVAAEAGATNDSGHTSVDSGSGSDAEFDIPLSDGGGIAHCWDFQHGATGFTVKDAQLVPGVGYMIAINDNDNGDRIERQFDAGKNITVSSVYIDETVTVDGSFDTGQFATGFAEFYGLSDGRDDPQTSLAYATTEVDIDIVTIPDGASAQSNPIQTSENHLNSLDGGIWIDTVWGSGTGSSVSVSANGKTEVANKPTLEAAAQSGFTLYVGGNTSNPETNPTLNITVRSICVSFH